MTEIVLFVHLQESHKQMDDDAELEAEIERELQEEQARNNAEALAMQAQENRQEEVLNAQGNEIAT